MPLTDEEFLDHCKEILDVFNYRYFDGILKFEVGMYPRDYKRRLASCCGRLDGTSLVKMTPITKLMSHYELEETLVHELLHVAQFHFKLRAEHGPKFKELARKFGIPINSAMSCASGEVRSMVQLKTGAPPKR